ncbi:MAG: TIGR03118 family protein [Cyanobacteria bacterium P01_F01_bin.86]
MASTTTATDALDAMAMSLVETESNDTIDTATPVAIATATPHAIASGSINFDFENNRDVDATEDVDFYAFELAAGDTIKLDLDEAGETLPLEFAELILFDSGGNTVALGSFANVGPDDAFISNLPYIEYTATVDGNYFAAVSGSFNAFYDPFTAGSGSGVTFEAFNINGFGDYTLGFELVNAATPVAPPTNETPEIPASDAPPLISLETITATYGLNESVIVPAVVETVNDLGLDPVNGFGGSTVTLVLSTEGEIPDSGVEVVVNTGVDLADYFFTFGPFTRGAEILEPVLDAEGNPSGIRLNVTEQNTLLNLTLQDKPEAETDGPESITFALEENPGIDVNPAAAASTVTVYDTAADVPAPTVEPVVGFTVDNSTLIEADGNTTTFTFTLSEPPPPEGVVVYVNTTTPSASPVGQSFQGLGQFDIFNAEIDGGLFPGSNFTSSGFYFKVTESTATITFAAFPDAETEGIQEFQVFLEESAGYQIDPEASSVVVTTADTAESLPQLSLSVAPAILIESENTVSVHTFNLSTTPPPEGIVVSVTATGLEEFDLTGIATTGISGDMSVAESDPPQLVFTMAEATATISLPVTADSVAEGLETATFTLNPSDAYQVSPLAEGGSFEIVDTPDEVPPSPVEVELNDTLNSAIAIPTPTPGDPITIAGEINYEFDFFGNNPIIDVSEDVDLYAFELAAGESITINVDADDSESLLQPVLRVFDADDGELDAVGQVETLEAITPGEGEATLTFTAETAGTYYAGISVLGNDDYDPAVVGSGSGWTVEGVAEPGAYEVTFAAPTEASAGYVVTNLVANEAQYDPLLLDPYLSLGWGIAIRPAGLGGHFWLSASGTGTSTEYVGDVGGVPIYQDSLKIVEVTPTEFNPFGISGPTGQVFNGSSDFVITQDHPNGDITAPSKFIFVATDGGISAWTERANDDGTIDRPLVSEVVVDKFLDSIYYGVAITNFENENRLYVADFGATPEIEVYDASFNEITSDFAFTNPFADEGYAEYNIQLIEDSLFVAYAAPNPEVPGDEIVEEGLGGIAEFDLDGNLITTWDSGGLLDAPWGFVMAPDNFGEYSNMLLVSNFGDGTIVAFDPETQEAVDYLRDGNGDLIAIDGLWGLTFGNGGSLGETNDLYFAAGNDLGDGAGDGVFGKVEVAADVDIPEPGGDQTFEGTAEDDLYVVSGDSNTFLLAEGNDTVTARGLNQIIEAGSGDDILSIGSGVVDLGEGTNFVAASDGSLTVTAGSGDDTVNLVEGDLTAEVGEGDNHVTSGDGNDVVTAGSGDDIVHAGAGVNTLDLGDGDNTVNTIVNLSNFLLSVGQTTVTTGSGSDTFIMGAGEGVLTITNYDASDRFELVGFKPDFSGVIGFSDLTIAQDGDDTVISLTGTEDVLAILQNVQADAINSGDFELGETLVGTEADDTLKTAGGDDTVAGELGSDIITGGGGDDVLRGDRNSRQTQDGEPGGDDIIFGGEGSDRIGGKAGNDILSGDAGDDFIWGDDGDDILMGVTGNDILTGDNGSRGSGSDTFVFGNGDGTDTITDFEVGLDFIGLVDGELVFEDLTLTQDGVNTLVGVTNTNETLAILNNVQASALDVSSFVVVPDVSNPSEALALV